MRTDRELLELAARAAGMQVLREGAEWPRENIGWFFCVQHGIPAMHDRASAQIWKPSHDDGDALRLARAVGLRVDFNYYTGSDRRCGIAVWPPGDDCPYPPFWTLYGKRPDVDARCTIVRAAAAQVSPPALNQDSGGEQPTKDAA